MISRLRRSIGESTRRGYKHSVPPGLTAYYFRFIYFVPQRRPKKEMEVRIPLDPAKARELVFQRAAKLLAAKQRSVEELREKLSTTRGATKALVDEAIARLREYGYLDDAKYAQSYASLRLRERPIGRRRLQRDLWLKKVDK